MKTLDLADAVRRYHDGEGWPSGVWLTAFGGRPIRPDDDILTCLGESALLTRLNPKSKTRAELGALCLDLGHDWGGHWVTLTLTFFGYDPRVQQAWARDSRFRLSWSERTDEAWSATGSIKDWRRYTSFRADASFHAVVRSAMADALETLSTFSKYFSQQERQ